MGGCRRRSNLTLQIEIASATENYLTQRNYFMLPRKDVRVVRLCELPPLTKGKNRNDV